jgi:Uncharacterized protein involved in methicillin resistance
VIRVRAATDADAAAWQAHLERTASGDFLHDWAWAGVAAFDGEPQRRFMTEEDGALVAIIVAQVRRLPIGRSFWYVPHGPVLDYAHPRAGEWLRAIVIGLRELARGDRALAIKLDPRIEAGSPAARLFDGLRLRREGRSLQVGRTQMLDLSGDEAAIFAAFDAQTRRSIRRAERDGVEVRVTADAHETRAIDALHALVLETQRHAGFPTPSLERYRIAWRGLAGAGRARIVEAWFDGRPMASGMLVVEGDRSFFLFAGSLREEPGVPKKFPSYAMQWQMIRTAREMGSRQHDLWGIEPEGAGSEHAWYGVGVFKKRFGGRSVTWAGSSDIVVEPTLYRLRRALGMMRGWAPRVRR